MKSKDYRATLVADAAWNLSRAQPIITQARLARLRGSTPTSRARGMLVEVRRAEAYLVAARRLLEAV